MPQQTRKAKYWRLRIAPFGGQGTPGVFLSLHSTRSDIHIFQRDAAGRPNHRFDDQSAAYEPVIAAVFARYAKTNDILLPALMAQKPGVIITGLPPVVAVGRKQTNWSAWFHWLHTNFERWTATGGSIRPEDNPRGQYDCEVRYDVDHWTVVGLKRRDW